MNWFLILFAIFFAAEHLLEYCLTFLNLNFVRQHEKEVPSYFRDKITLEEYQKSIRYTRDKARLGVISFLVSLGTLISGLDLSGALPSQRGSSILLSCRPFFI